MADSGRGARGTVLVTGSSTGIGRATAVHLAELGFHVFAGVRKSADGDALRAGSAAIEPLIVDVTDAATIAAAAESIAAATEGRLDGLVNNAGIAVGGPLEHVPIEDWRRQLEVNVIGQVAVIQAMLPMLRSARGRIVSTSSIGGRVANPMMAPYATSKFALEALSDSLRRELKPQGIAVSLIEPGAVATPIWDKAAVDAEAAEAGLSAEAQEPYKAFIATLKAEIPNQAKIGVTPERVARQIGHALTTSRPKARYLVGRDAHMLLALSRLLPSRALDSVLVRYMTRKG